MKLKLHITALMLVCLSTNWLSAQQGYRQEIMIPDIPGYKTLKCDFHIHTVFSDGLVWPTVRVEEAWREGLDVISITDHIELQPHKTDIPTQHNRPYELALDYANELGMVLVRGSEVTRSMPPGHFNAIFLEDSEALDVDDWRDAFRAASEQGAFIFWNHPGWKQPDEIPVWYEEHTEILNNKWIDGLEIANERSYYPLALEWGLDKDLTLIGNSDIHNTMHLFYELHEGDHRAITLVFAKDKTPGAVRDALDNRRTAVYHENMLIGEDTYLEPIFYNSISYETKVLQLHGKSRAYLQVHNHSDIDFNLVSAGDNTLVSGVDKITLLSDRTTLIPIRAKDDEPKGLQSVKLPFMVTNLRTGPEKNCKIELEFKVEFVEPR